MACAKESCHEFPQFRLVECGFNAVISHLTKTKDHLQIVDYGILKMLVTHRERNIDKLLAYQE